MSKGKRQRLIVFDMDGVLVDVTSSYRETVRKAVRLFFCKAPSFESLPDPLFPLDDLARLKQSGGLNNDWDLTVQTLSLLCALVSKPNNLSLIPSLSMISHMDLSGLAEFLRSTRTPLSDLMARYGRRKDPLVEACYRGDIGTGNIIKQIFQEIYLGKDLFKAAYKMQPQFCEGEGLINHEKAIIPTPVIEALGSRNILAVATGRPRFEADYTMDRFGLRQYFQIVMTLDDCLREEERILREYNQKVSLSKPNPFMLDAIAAKLGGHFRESYYVGDMPDDMKAAKASRMGYKGVGFISPAADNETIRDALVSAGATLVVEDPSQLAAVIS